MDVEKEGGRRYRILSLLGRGGFGNVYRARLHGSDGFTKDVALKLLKQSDVPGEVVSRFRDEARILGLIRDRAVVGVDPPTRLNGRWAIVMEYVDGASLSRLGQLGPVPPSVAVEIVREVARALDKVWRHPGPDGQPLHLVHRDLKPANVQITPEGDVKVLDFGIARAEFDTRESRTSTNIGGTIGFIAPERLLGVEGPAGDVYSLGVLLRVCVTTEKPTTLDLPESTSTHPVERTAEVLAVVGLAERMRARDPEARPTAREVEEACRALRPTLSGPTLADWAPTTVPPASRLQDDDLVGSLLTETLTLARATASPAPRRSRWWLGAAGAAGVAVAGTTLAVFALGVGLAAWVGWDRGGIPAPVADERGPADPPEGPTAASGAPDPTPPPPEPAPPEALEAGALEVEPLEAEAPGPVPVPPAPPAPDPAPAAARPGPAPIATAPAPPAAPPPVELAAVTIESTPPGAAVYLDGVRVGTTPLRSFPVSAGTHQLRLESGGAVLVERSLRMGGRRGGTRWRWDGQTLVAE